MMTSFMEYLTLTGNTPRTIDKKVGTIRALLNFAKKHKLYNGDNPAKNRNLVSKKEKAASGSNFYQIDDIKAIFACDAFKAYRLSDPAFYVMMLGGILTGARVSALAALLPGDLKASHAGFFYIRIRSDKTAAGKRDIPIPKAYAALLQSHLDQNGNMGVKLRADGKGASDPIRKQLAKHLQAIQLTQEHYTFHGLRKTLNNFLKSNGVSFETRCQFIGHEFEHVNNVVYSEKEPLENIAKAVLPTIEKLMGLIGFPDKPAAG